MFIKWKLFFIKKKTYWFSQYYLEISKKQEPRIQQFVKCLWFLFTLPVQEKSVSNLCEMRCHFKKQKGKPNLPGTWSFFLLFLLRKSRVLGRQTGEGKAIMREMLGVLLVYVTLRGNRKKCPSRQWPQTLVRQGWILAFPGSHQLPAIVHEQSSKQP